MLFHMWIACYFFAGILQLHMPTGPIASWGGLSLAWRHFVPPGRLHSNNCTKHRNFFAVWFSHWNINHYIQTVINYRLSTTIYWCRQTHCLPSASYTNRPLLLLQKNFLFTHWLLCISDIRSIVRIILTTHTSSGPVALLRARESDKINLSGGLGTRLDY